MKNRRQKYQILAAYVNENFKINAMKTIHTITTLSIVSLLLASCNVSNVPYAYDDLYYSPSNDPVQQARIDPNAPQSNPNQTGYYSDRYTQEGGTNPNSANYQDSYAQEGSEAINQDPAEVEYYNTDYAQTLQQINAPVRSFNTYDPYQRDRILYTQNPMFMTPSVYNGYQFWDPFMPTTGLSVGWNSFNGWNVGVNTGFGFGCGRALNPYIGFYDPFWGNNMWGWNDPFWGPQFGWGNNFGWNNPWGWNNGFNNFAFRNGYRQGFNDGNFNNYRNYAIGNNGSNGRRQIIAPRGSGGSVNVRSTGGDRPVRPVRGDVNGRTNPVQSPNNSRPVRPAQSAPTRPSAESRPSQSAQPSRPTNGNTRPVRSTTRPPRYQTPRAPATNTRPAEESRPVRTTPARPTTRPSAQPQRPTNTRPAQQQARPSYSRPASRPAQQQARPATTQPRQQSRPTYNNSRPTYSAPRSTGGSSGGSSGGSRTTPSRPSRR